MIIAGTGHRPDGCEEESIVRFKIRQVFKEVEPDKVITGMAAGFDLWLADEALAHGIEIVAAKPWAGHEPQPGDDELYSHVEGNAIEIVNVSSSKKYPGPACYHARNRYMVDACTHVLAYLDPKAESGGTFQCCKYATGRKPIRNIYNAPPF